MTSRKSPNSRMEAFRVKIQPSVRQEVVLQAYIRLAVMLTVVVTVCVIFSAAGGESGACVWTVDP